MLVQHILINNSIYYVKKNPKDKNPMVTSLDVDYAHSPCLWQPGMGFASSGAEVTDGCELSKGCWKLNPGHLEKYSVL